MPGRRALGLEPAAILDDRARARGGGDPAVRARADLADRLVAARAGRADGKYRPAQAPPADSRAAATR